METKVGDESRDVVKPSSSQIPTEANNPPILESQAAAPVVEAPDPDEDDLDDLDGNSSPRFKLIRTG